MLSNPKAGETLILYLAVSDFAISAVLVREDDGVQLPVYYVSKRLADVETRYTSLEKLAYALILASRKLRPYFQAHKIEVRTSYPLRQVMHKPESSGRMLKWTVELSQFEVDYKPMTAIKGQALADFVLEFPPYQEVEPGALVVIPSTEEVGLESQNSAPWWSLFVDGASNGDGAGAGIELISPEAHKIRRATHLAFHATNNDAEYEALINGLKLALEMKVENLNVFSDSMIVVYQINGGYQAKGPRTELYLKCAQRIIARFNEVRLELIPRGQNEGADELAKLGSRRESTLLGTVPLDIQRQLSVLEHEVGSLSNELGPTWMTPILAYIKEGSLPDEKNEARRIKYKAARHVIYDGILYRRGFSVSLLKCIDGDECNYILRERYANYYNSPVASLKSLMSPWPFSIWGFDLIGELPKVRGGVKYAVVAVDYFTKWAEAEPLATITAKKLREFVHKAIVCRYGIPYKMISDNRKQFDSKDMREFCEQLGIQKSFSAVCHPQSNGQTEAVTKIIKHTLKAKLEEKKGAWPEELAQVLWLTTLYPEPQLERPISLWCMGVKLWCPLK
ncbi:uncharacterized protein LOC141690829 [Apium graveolens]|uniref:uncharacterized protein LOC141690829 n=1 Tax=Apium graveolens TaxID=4045 RepID=UPI003D7B1781